MSISKERLALFLPGLYEGGAERIILNLASGMAARGHAVDLVLARAEGPYMSQVPNSVRVVDLKAARVLSSVPALVGYIKRERPRGVTLCIIYQYYRSLGKAPRWRPASSSHQRTQYAFVCGRKSERCPLAVVPETSRDGAIHGLTTLLRFQRA